MDLIIDANIIFAALLAPDGETRNLLFRRSLRLFAPTLLIEEVKRHYVKILRRTRLEAIELDDAIRILSSRIVLVQRVSFESRLLEAHEMISDPNDLEYLALALHLNLPIWSNDTDFRVQNTVPVYTTQQLIASLRRGDSVRASKP